MSFHKLLQKKTRMHSSRMLTVCSSSCVLGGGHLPQCMLGYTPPTRPGPPAPGPGDTLARPLNLSSGYGPGETPGQTPQHPPWVWAWRPSSQTPQPPPPWVWATRPPVNKMTDTCKNITYANFVCGR